MCCRHHSFPVAIRNLFFVAIFFVLASSLRGQDAATGGLRGVVLDAHGARVVGADIVAIRTETGIRYHTATDSAGRFLLDLLPPGDYSARAEAEGMSPQVSPPVRVDVGAVSQLTFMLSVAGAKETVTVSEPAPMVEVNPTAVSALIDERAIADLPLNGRRFTDLLLLAPGVTQDPRGLTSESNGDLAYGGIRGYQSSYLVDGLDNNNGFFAQARGRYRAPYQFSNEVVREFRVSSNSYGAESGRAGGAIVNVVTKSGTNQWHGTGFYYLKDSSLGATPAFVGFKPASQQHQFGGTLGGPIQRNKTFFFAGYDQHIFHVPAVVEFLDGNTVVTPQAGTISTQGDYENCDSAIGGMACDMAVVTASAARLSTMGGTFQAKLLGNTGFLKVDHALTAHHYLSARLSTSRYYGTNNVFLDPASPVTNNALSGNGEEDVTTESASLSLLSNITPRLTSHLRSQFSRDLQQSFPNALGARTKIYNLINSFGQSSILPRQTWERRLHTAETLSLSAGRNEWKFGGDAMFTWDDNYFPSLFGGEYIYDNIPVDPWTFTPMHGGLELTPLRAWAHEVPRYYVQNLGNPVSHPDSNDYAAFAQDTLRLTRHFALSLGVRYDLQTFGSQGLMSNPLWPAAGRMPSSKYNFAPRVGLAYGIGAERPLMVRAGFGIFYTRIPQIYQSAVINDNGLNTTFLELDNMDFYQRQLFPAYPHAAADCPRGPVACTLPDALKPYASNEVSAFAPGFRTPRVQQGSLSLQRELADGLTGGLSYLYVHGVDMIRARDVNLPPPTYYSYPIYDASGSDFQDSLYKVASFGTWQTTKSINCPYAPCINDVVRPVAQLGAIDQFESAASSVYHGMTVSLRKRMSHGVYFRLAYTWAHAIDDGQDALVAGQPATVQNSYSTKSERGPSVTDQRHRLSVSWIAEPRPFDPGPGPLATIFDHWRASGIMTYGSGRPAQARVDGDPNQDQNTSNDRLPGFGNNAFTGPDYATMNLRLARKINFAGHYRLELMAESFNLFNRDNKRFGVSDNGFWNSAGQFVSYSKRAGGTYYPAYYQQPTSFMRAMSAYAPRQIQLSLRFLF
jgi:Carboxypeptidase regulatory-like domain/TonB dependent receptor-like, beta-barrel